MPTTEIYKDLVRMTIPEVFKWMREAKEILELTNQQISDGCGVPLGTVSRVIAGSYMEVKSTTLRPMVAFFAERLEGSDTENAAEQVELSSSALEGLNMMVKIRDAELEALTKSYKVLEDKAAFLQAENKRKDKWVAILATITIVLFTGIIALLVYDLTHPDVGWYQTAAQWFASMGVRI